MTDLSHKVLTRKIYDPHVQACLDDTHQAIGRLCWNLSSAMIWLLDMVQVVQLCFLLCKMMTWAYHLILLVRLK